MCWDGVAWNGDDGRAGKVWLSEGDGGGKRERLKCWCG